MKIEKASLDGVLIIKADSYEDDRGFFMETYHQERYVECGITEVFVQDNLSFSVEGTLRGLHYQHPRDQAKLVQVIKGAIFDVCVDVRQGSPTLGQWVGHNLSHENRRQLLIPEGFAHGFCVLSKTAHVFYKCTEFYSPRDESGVLWSDPDLKIDWPLQSPLVSSKDSKNPRLSDIPPDRLPVYKA